MPVPAVRFTTEPSVAAAKAAFAAQDPRVRVLFDNGGGSLGPGALQPTYEAGFATWPPAGTVTPTASGPGHAAGGPRSEASTASFRPDPAVRPADDLASSANAWAAQPPYDWTTGPRGQRHRLRDAGVHQRDDHRRSRQPQPDAQVDGARHRPAGHGDRGAARDGTQEEYITSGFLRSSDRTLSSASTVLDPVPTYLAAERRNLPAGASPWCAPGGPHRPHVPAGHPPAHRHLRPRRGPPVVDLRHARPPTTRWSTPWPSAVRRVRRSWSTRSHGVVPTAGLPACGALRGEPCRAYAPLANQTTDVVDSSTGSARSRPDG